MPHAMSSSHLNRSTVLRPADDDVLLFLWVVMVVVRFGNPNGYVGDCVWHACHQSTFLSSFVCSSMAAKSLAPLACNCICGQAQCGSDRKRWRWADATKQRARYNDF